MDPYFLLNGVPPTDVTCSSSHTDTCTTTIYTNVNVTAEDPLADASIQTSVEPCARCDYEYDTDHTCSEVQCSLATCLSPPSVASNETASPDAGENVTVAGVNTTSEETNVATEAPIPESVTICMEYSRSDSFSTTELRVGSRYQCTQQTAKKIYRVHYRTGVTNVRNTELILEDTMGPGGTDEILEACTFVVDDTACNSCRWCDDDEEGFFELDCSNIREGATTSCDSFLDHFYAINPFDGISPKLLVLQEGFEHTDPPTEAPTDPDSMDPFPGNGYEPRKSEKDDDDVNAGAVAAAIVVVIVIAAVLFIFRKKICKQKSDHQSPPPGHAIAAAVSTVPDYTHDHINPQPKPTTLVKPLYKTSVYKEQVEA